ncbi:MAG: fibronectin, type III domain-containing protein [Parcubacteria group bacterium Gr01-1014_30]|nr:MAG: fibronectin, type III domain-containing protein [Parcubacteria group bacterium Gr01-1014_30]
MRKKYFLVFISIILTLVFFPQIIWAQSALLYFSPSSGTFTEGQNFWLTIMVDTKGVAVNAVAAYFSYPEDKLTPLGVDTSGSVMTIWAEKSASNGKVEIAGGLVTPGFSGIKKIASVGFRPKVSSGSVNFKFNQDSAVLADADNKNILNLNQSGQGNYSLAPRPTAPAPAPTPQPAPAPEPEPRFPLISEVELGEITRNEATISWKTDLETDSLIEYGLTADTMLITVADESLTKEHSLKLSELDPGRLYYFRIRTKTQEGVQGATQAFTFTTLGYVAEIKVFDADTNQPLPEAEVKVALPEEITKITDQEGKVFFDQLPLGEQWISVKYQDVLASYQITVTDQEPQSFDIGVKLPKIKKGVSIFWVAILLILTGLVIIVIVTLVRNWILKEREKNIL